MEKPPKLGEYNRKGDPREHVRLVNDQLNYFSVDDASKFKLLALSLVGLSRPWFNNFPDKSIESWTNFYKRFTAHFIVQNRKPVTVAALSGIIQWKKESM